MNNRKRRGLGQGLGALIPGGAEPPLSTPPPPDNRGGEDSGFRQIGIDAIVPNPFQPRDTNAMDQAKLDELAKSIREHGIIQPLIVTQIDKAGQWYRLIAGERRWNAAKRAGLETVPVVIREASESQMLEWAIVENIQRADLNPMEEALAYQQMVDLNRMSQEEIADRVGKARTTVTNILALLKLPEPVQNMVRAGELTEGHARNISRLSSASEMMELAERVRSQDLTVRQTEELVTRYKRGERPRADKPNLISIQDRDRQRQFTSALGAKVELRRQRKGGQVIIYFENDDDLQALYRKFSGE